MDKYYTPSIEDIRVGYECEIKSGSLWYKEIVQGISKKEGFINTINCDYYINNDLYNIRTPYLTKEQIEAEGWIHTGGKMISVDRQDFKKLVGIKGTCELHYTPLNKKMKIEQRNHVRDNSNNYTLLTIFDGYCQSINEFRTILKLLSIQ